MAHMVSFLSMMEAKLPPGFRFHPRDEELITDYLARRVSGDGGGCAVMVDVDLNKVEPWDLPEVACVGGKEWYFYSLKDRKYATGQRTNRATLSGYWKATGKDRQVVDARRGGRLVGMRKTLVFYQGRAPKGRKTEWVMHEFRIEGAGAGAGGGSGHNNHLFKPSSSSSSSSKEDWVLCRVFNKTRAPPSANPSHGSPSSYDDDSGSSSLPPLTDTYINFEHPHPPLQPPQQPMQGYEHAPCFSTLLASQPPQLLRHNHHPFPPPPPPMPSMTEGGGGGGLLDISSYLNPFECEKKAIRAVLDQLSKGGDDGVSGGGGIKIEGAAAEGGSGESYLAETGEHSMWSNNPFS